MVMVILRRPIMDRNKTRIKILEKFLGEDIGNWFDIPTHPYEDDIETYDLVNGSSYLIVDDDENRRLASSWIRDNIGGFGNSFILKHTSVIADSPEGHEVLENARNMGEYTEDFFARIIDNVSKFVNEVIMENSPNIFIECLSSHELGGWYIYRMS